MSDRLQNKITFISVYCSSDVLSQPAFSPGCVIDMSHHTILVESSPLVIRDQASFRHFSKDAQGKIIILYPHFKRRIVLSPRKGNNFSFHIMT